MSASDKVRLPEVMVFAGPNGSGKTTITSMAKTVGAYINADDIKRATLCTDLEAAVKAEQLRESALERKTDFTFETVLSTDRNLIFLERVKAQGYFVRGIYVLTASSMCAMFCTSTTTPRSPFGFSRNGRMCFSSGKTNSGV